MEDGIVVAKSEIQRCGGKRWVWLQKGNMRATGRLKMLSVLPVKVIHEPGDENV